jgi:hypothetical protein
MNTASKPLSESVLRRLTNVAITTFLGEAASYEAAARPGLQLALSNEAVADLNLLVVGADADHGHFRAMLNSCLDRQLPFLAVIFPSAGKAFDDIAADLGLTYAVDKFKGWPHGGHITLARGERSRLVTAMPFNLFSLI